MILPYIKHKIRVVGKERQIVREEYRTGCNVKLPLSLSVIQCEAKPKQNVYPCLDKHSRSDCQWGPNNPWYAVSRYQHLVSASFARAVWYFIVHSPSPSPQTNSFGSCRYILSALSLNPAQHFRSNPSEYIITQTSLSALALHYPSLHCRRQTESTEMKNPTDVVMRQSLPRNNYRRNNAINRRFASENVLSKEKGLYPEKLLKVLNWMLSKLI